MPRESSADAGTFDPLHDIDLVHGKLTDRNDLPQAFAAFRKSGSTHLCIFFHGGLTSRADALKTAGDLIQGYSQKGTYPFFFIWNSDLLTVIEGDLRYQDDPDFIEAVNLGVSTVARKIDAALGKGRARAGLPGRIPARGHGLNLKTLAKVARAYDRVWSRALGLQLSVTQSDLDAFHKALLRIDRARERRREPQPPLFPAERIRGAANPLARIIQRLNSVRSRAPMRARGPGHEHGILATVIEEFFIATGIADLVREKVWEPMKKDIDDAFADDPKAGGAVFLQYLKKACTELPKLRVTLIGHSAGAIYVQRFIEALDVMFGSESPQTVEMITLAAAMSFERMLQGLEALQRRVSAVRVFGLKDGLEAGYWEFPIYPRSMLYVVCSLLEADPEADKPLLGMERYWSGSDPYNQPDINLITQFINPDPSSPRAVWSLTSKNAKRGYRSQATRHSLPRELGFPEEKETNESVCDALWNGF